MATKMIRQVPLFSELYNGIHQGTMVFGSEPVEENMPGGFRSLAPTLGLTGRDSIQIYSHRGSNYIIKQMG